MRPLWNLMIPVCLGLLMSGCMYHAARQVTPEPIVWEAPPAHRDALRYEHAAQKYAHVRPDAEVLYDGYVPFRRMDVSKRVINGNKVSPLAELYSFLWEEDFQAHMHVAMMRIAPGNGVNWTADGTRYRFLAHDNLQYIPFTNRPCRTGVLYRELPMAMDETWEQMPGKFCRVGRSGEWLPMAGDVTSFAGVM